MDKETAIELSHKYASKVKARYPSCKVVLYGSYIDETNTPDSDIDIAVIFDHFPGNWLEASVQLWKDIEDIDTKIEPVLLERIHDRSGFCEYVLSTGIEL